MDILSWPICCLHLQGRDRLQRLLVLGFLGGCFWEGEGGGGVCFLSSFLFYLGLAEKRVKSLSRGRQIDMGVGRDHDQGKGV